MVEEELIGFAPQLWSKTKKLRENSRDFSGKYQESKEISRELIELIGKAINEKNYSETKNKFFRSVREDLKGLTIRWKYSMIRLVVKLKFRKIKFQLKKELKRNCYDKIVALKEKFVIS